MSPSIRRAAVALLVAALPAWLLFLPPTGPVASAAELRIEAPRFSFDRENNRYVYEDSRLTLGDLTLFAEEMEFNPTDGLVRAEGYVRLETTDLTGIGERLELDVNTRILRFEDASLYSAATGAYVRAEGVVMHPDRRLQLRSCTVTLCPPGETASWHLAASSLDVYPEEVAVAWNPRLFVGPVPVLWLPVVAGPVVRDRRTGVLGPTLQQETSSQERYDLGWRLKVPVFINLGYDHDLTATPDLIQERGTALELEYNYAFWSEQDGRLTVWGLRERDPRDPNAENNILAALGETPPAEPLTRYRLDWQHSEAPWDGGRLVLSYRHASDGQVRAEYDHLLEYRPYRTYQAGLAGQWQWADAALTFEQNADYLAESVYADSEGFTDLGQRPQLMPRLSTRVGGRVSNAVPLALELGLSATRFVAEQAVSGELYAASPSVTLPIALGGAFELRPTLTRHFFTYTGLTQYDASGPDTPLDDESFSQSEGTVELRTALARVYETENGRFAAIKHRITPRLILTAAEDVAQPFTDQVLRARVAQRMATLRLDNVLLGRAHDAPPAPDEEGQGQEEATRPLVPPGTAGWSPAEVPTSPPVSELVHVNLIQRYNFLRRTDAPALEGPGFDRPQETEFGEPLLPLLLEMSVAGPAYAVSARFNYHHQLERNTQTTLGVSGAVTSRTRLRFGYAFNEFAFLTPDNKLVPASNGFNFGGELQMNDTVSTGFDARVNLQDAPPPLDRRLDRGSAFVDYHPICYAVRLSYSEEVVPLVEEGVLTYRRDRRILLTFTLGGVGGTPLTLSRNASTTPYPQDVAHASSPAQCRG